LLIITTSITHHHHTMKHLFILSLGAILFTSCGNSEKPEAEQKDTAQITVAKDSSAPALDTAQIIRSIDDYRMSTEKTTSGMKALSVDTKNLREKIKQKWSRIEFYSNDNGLMRVRAYPHEQITKRNEEFYFMNNNPVLAIVQDQGGGEGREGDEKENFSKMYYYHEGKLLKEVNTSSEKEYSIRNSESEELFQEAMEYMEIFNANKGK
jgi:hypothetical protein